MWLYCFLFTMDVRKIVCMITWLYDLWDIWYLVSKNSLVNSYPTDPFLVQTLKFLTTKNKIWKYLEMHHHLQSKKFMLRQNLEMKRFVNFFALVWKEPSTGLFFPVVHWSLNFVTSSIKTPVRMCDQFHSCHFVYFQTWFLWQEWIYVCLNMLWYAKF